MEYRTLYNGVKMPMLGFGVYQVSEEDTEQAVLTALQAGYRLIDTARAYRNEAAVGRAIKASGIPRGEIFLTTKLWVSDFSYEGALAATEKSLRRLGTDYIDLMLLHQPYGDRYGAWRALEEAYKLGKVRAIGVSNFYPDHFIDFAHNNEITPAVNQIETHVFQQQQISRKYMDELGIAHMAWGPLAEGKNGFFTNPVLTAIGKKYGKTAAQVALRYLTQRNVIIIPKSTHKERMQQNLDIFDFTLSPEDMDAILKLDTGKNLIMPSHHDPEITKMFMGWM